MHVDELKRQINQLMSESAVGGGGGESESSIDILTPSKSLKETLVYKYLAALYQVRTSYLQVDDVEKARRYGEEVSSWQEEAKAADIDRRLKLKHSFS
jgi:hypothetical protein